MEQRDAAGLLLEPLGHRGSLGPLGTGGHWIHSFHPFIRSVLDSIPGASSPAQACQA